jgi:DNA helicase II / ATP-dependent DNA helicase PcrA
MTDETLSFLDTLNAQQRQAVTAGPGQVLVLAGPGSGKTRVLTYRIAYLVQAEQVRPYNILAVTFTNKAAREMEARLAKVLGEPSRDLWLGTFHAVCARLLRREAERLPVEANFVILDSDDQEAIVKQSIRDLKLDEKLYRPNSLHAAISRAKNELIKPKDYPRSNYRDEVVARVYERYQARLLENNSVDFDDLLFYSVQLLEEHAMIREKYGFRFHNILVDEFQDTNIAQYQLLRHLSEARGNLFVVGDEDQSIYRWRGADYRNVLRFEEDYPQCQKILLEQNYRSTQNVLDTARSVIDHNFNRTPKKLFTQRGTGEQITLYEAVDDHAEAAYVVEAIRILMMGGQTKGSEFAVMYRTNAQSRLLEEAFLSAGVAYRLVGAQRFYGRREVKDLISFLRLIQNPSDEISLNRVINVPPRGVGDKTLVTLQTAAQQAGITAGEVLLRLGKEGDKSPYWKTLGRSVASLADFGAMLAGWREAATTLSLPVLFDRIIAESTYQSYVDDGSEEGNERWENVQELKRLAFEYSERGLTAFLENLALVSDQDTLPEESAAPTLLTLHAAKGLEFGHVFIIGLDEGILPHSRSLDDPEEMAEERRLFYVGITRARNKLNLVRANQRSTYGSFEASVPSRFLSDIPDHLLTRQGRGSYRSQASSWNSRSSSSDERRSRSPSRWESGGTHLAPPSSSGYKSAPPPPKPPAQMQFKAGNHVRHPVWGEGLVVDARMDGDDERVDVFFDSVGFKRLIAALAKLEIIQK